jgi:hypothetical protein
MWKGCLYRDRIIELIIEAVACECNNEGTAYPERKAERGRMLKKNRSFLPCAIHRLS